MVMKVTNVSKHEIVGTRAKKGTTFLLRCCLESMNERKGFTTFFQNIPKDAFFW